MMDDTKKTVDDAVDNLRKEGYVVLMILVNQNPTTTRKDRLEVLCSETNDPVILRAMLMNTLKILSGPAEADRLN